MCIYYYYLLGISTKNVLLRRILKNHHLKLAVFQNLVSCISSIHGHYMQVLSHLGTNIHKQSSDSKPTSKYCLGRHLTRSQWDRPFVSPVSTLLLLNRNMVHPVRNRTQGNMSFSVQWFGQHYHSSKHVLLMWINTQHTKYGSWAWLEVVWYRKTVLMFWFTCWLCCVVMQMSPHMRKWGYKIFQHIVQWKGDIGRKIYLIIIFSFGTCVYALAKNGRVTVYIILGADEEA